MDTHSKNNQDQPKSWEQLAASASKASPPEDLDVLSGVKRAIANEGWSTVEDVPDSQRSWLDELGEVFDQKWALAGFSVLAIAIVVFGVVSVDMSQDVIVAYELSSWFNP